MEVRRVGGAALLSGRGAINRLDVHRVVLGPVGLLFPVFCFIDFALGIQTFGVAIDR